MSILAHIDDGTGIEDACSKVATFVPQFLASLVILKPRHGRGAIPHNHVTEELA